MMRITERSRRTWWLLLPLAVVVGIGASLLWPPGKGDSDADRWRRVVLEHFNGSRLDAQKWHAYDGHPRSDPSSLWSPSKLKVADGVLTITTSKDDGVWTSGGINGLHHFSARAGKVSVRARGERAPGISFVAMLWPRSNTWPPEVDFVENRTGLRNAFTTTVRYGSREDPKQIQKPSPRVDMTRWHTYSVEWDSRHVTYSIDGRPWGSVREHVPTVPMGLAIQANAVDHGPAAVSDATPTRSTVQVDWVACYVPR